MDYRLATNYLDHFTRQAWHLVQPSHGIRNARGLTEPIWNWHLDAICDHLTAVVHGDIRHLLINIPPRHMKSLAVSVFFPTWVWAQDSKQYGEHAHAGPETQFLYASYDQGLATRDAVRSRRLMQNPWYQQRWGARFEFAGDQNQKTRYENNQMGYRIATSPGGLGTGEGGDIIVCDDPHNAKKAESETERRGVLSWWDETMQTRVNDPSRSAFIIIMQRLNEADLSGHVLEGGNYTHLCLPARYEGTPAMVPGATVGVDLAPPSTRFTDPRTEIGEPLFPGFWGEEELAELEQDMTAYAKAGQLQQHPAPREGGMFYADNFIYRTEAFTRYDKVVRYWDKAGTEGGGARTAGVKMGRTGNGYYVVLDVVKGQWSAGKREKVIKDTAIEDGVEVEVWVEQEPGSGGKESAESTIKNLEGFSVHADRATGDKEVRAEPYAAHLENHGVYIMMGPWNKDFVEEHQIAPRGKFKDQWDAASGAFNRLNIIRTAGVW